MKLVLATILSPLLLLAAVTGHAETEEVNGFTFLVQDDGALYKTYQKEMSSYFAIDLIVFGDGFTESETGAFEKQATTLLDGLWKIIPFDDNQCAFNVYFVMPISNTSGMSNPPLGSQTVSGDGFGYIMADLTKCESARAAVGLGDAEVMVVIANQDAYGAWYSGKLIAMSGAGVFSATLAHELGHVLTSLGDEYDYYYNNANDAGRMYTSAKEPPYPNVSLYGTYEDAAKIPWFSKIPNWVITSAKLDAENGNDSDFLPTTNMGSCICGTVGAWEGAGTYPNLYRPAEYCLMRRVCDVTPFCEICLDALRAKLQSPFVLFGCDAKLVMAANGDGNSAFSSIKEPPSMAPEFIPPAKEIELRLPTHLPAMIVVKIPPCYACLPIPVPVPTDDAVEPMVVSFEMNAGDWTMWVVDETGAVVAGPTQERGTIQKLTFDGTTSHEYSVLVYIKESSNRTVQISLDMLRNNTSVLR